jgi:hypothetical protein
LVGKFAEETKVFLPTNLGFVCKISLKPNLGLDPRFIEWLGGPFFADVISLKLCKMGNHHPSGETLP